MKKVKDTGYQFEFDFDANSNVDHRERTTRSVKKEEHENFSGEIKDFGEKIGGAKKDLYQEYIKNFSEISSDDLFSLPTSKIFPALNYKKLVTDNVMTELEAGLIKYYKEAIPRRPSATARYHNKVTWLDAVNEYALILKYIGHPNRIRIDEQNFVQIFEDTIGINKIVSIKNYIDLHRKLGFPEHDLNVKDYKIRSYARNQEVVFHLTKGLITLSTHQSYDEAVAQLKETLLSSKDKVKDYKLTVFHDRGRSCYLIGKKMGSGRYLRLIDNIESLEKAKEILRDEKERVNELYELATTPEERRNSNIERTGEDYRNGKNITPDMFSEAFGFRGVEFGNWVKNEERQQSLNDAYDSFMDLAKLINVPPNALSLNGELALAFGARGSGNAMAHYESCKVVINLTRTKGAGSLAHEWWHALDNYFSRSKGIDQGFVTLDPLAKNSLTKQDIRKEMTQAFQDLVKTIRNLPIMTRSEELDKCRTNPYWAKSTELTARCFEGWIVDKLNEQGFQNDYLANFKQSGEWAVNKFHDLSTYPYPLKDEAPVINTSFSSFFSTMQVRFDQATGKNVLFRKKQDVVKKPLDPAVIKNEINSLSKALNTKIIAINNRDQLPPSVLSELGTDLPAGAYDKRSQRVYIVMDQIESIPEVQKTVLHEVLGHHGLRSLFKDDKGFHQFLDKVWDVIPAKERKDLIQEHKDKYTATQEYIASFSEGYKNPKVWEKIVFEIKNAFRKIGIDLKVSDNDLNNILHRAKKNLSRPMNVSKDRDIGINIL